MIPAETRYKTHNGQFLAIVEAFKIWRHYLEGCKHKVLIHINHNNLCQFMNTKSISSRQVRWAQKLSYYHFWIDYHKGKANGAANALSQYPQQNTEEEDIFRAENIKILHRLQSSLARVSGLLVNLSQLSPFYQILKYRTTVLSQLNQFWNFFQSKLAFDSPYTYVRYRIAKKWWGSKYTQRFGRPPGGLERRWVTASVPRALVYVRNHPFLGDKLSSWWSTCRIFRNWQDPRVDWLKVLLAEPEEGHQDLCQRMWRLSDFKSRPPQAL